VVRDVASTNRKRLAALFVGLTVVFAILGAPIASAQAATSVTPMGPDAGQGIDRYQIVVGRGSSLWEIAVNHLPLTALEQGDAKAVEMVEQAWRQQFAERGNTGVQPEDAFVLEVGSGTFVSKSFRREPDRLIYESFRGDRLTTFPRDSTIGYRLQRADSPDRAEVLIHGGQADAVEEARRVYDVSAPDFLQVRAIRGALQERTSKLTIDTNKKYLDDFRMHRDRAVRVEETPEGMRAYWFDRDQLDIPYVRVDDAVGDETDPARFPRLFRVAYHRDGTIRKYLITEAGDSVGALGRPEDASWTRVLPTWQQWQPGQPEALPPFTPAISGAGSLLPGRILVVAFRPRVTQGSPQPVSASGRGSGIDCLGVPLGLLLAAGVVLGARGHWPS
jgi:hypothetical protein